MWGLKEKQFAPHLLGGLQKDEEEEEQEEEKEEEECSDIEKR
jgi:hypothetical protein